MHARVAPARRPDLLRRPAPDPLLPVARSEVEHPVGRRGLRRGRAREGVDRGDVAAREEGSERGQGGFRRRRARGGGGKEDALVADDGVRDGLHVGVPGLHVGRDELRAARGDIRIREGDLCARKRRRTGWSTAQTALSTTSPVKIENVLLGTKLRGGSVSEKSASEASRDEDALVDGAEHALDEGARRVALQEQGQRRKIEARERASAPSCGQTAEGGEGSARASGRGTRRRDAPVLQGA